MLTLAGPLISPRRLTREHLVRRRVRLRPRPPTRYTPSRPWRRPTRHHLLPACVALRTLRTVERPGGRDLPLERQHRVLHRLPALRPYAVPRHAQPRGGARRTPALPRPSKRYAWRCWWCAMSGRSPRWVRVVTIASVSVVAAVAAVASYVHMHELATEAGEGWRAHLIPLSVDGLLVAASMVMLVRRRAGLRAGVLPWTGLVLGLAASLGANVAAAAPTPLSWIVSGWPPLALALSFELLILVTRQPEAAAVLPDDEATPNSDFISESDATQPLQVVDPSSWWSDAPALDDPAEMSSGHGASGRDPDTDRRAAELIAAGAGRVRLERELGVTEHVAKQLIRAHRDTAEQGRRTS
ncbi:DUF2637 domain-containing protein [Pseudonocardia halophobica]|uniref:DUF2637 domain-containing protein n=1 Tax=Pseudonocardia halophobica TaxID=29401 RepID=UPI003D950007